MYAHVKKPKENKSKTIANPVSQKKSDVKQGFGFVENRHKFIAQRKLQIVTTLSYQKLGDVVQRNKWEYDPDWANHLRAVYKHADMKDWWNDTEIYADVTKDGGNCHGWTYMNDRERTVIADEINRQHMLDNKILILKEGIGAEVSEGKVRIVEFWKGGTLYHSARRIGDRWIQRWSGVEVMLVVNPMDAVFQEFEKRYYDYVLP